jgi:MSHA biogenesis protein MshK
MAKTLISSLTILLSVLAWPAQAQQFRDPTQPPAAYTQAGSDKAMFDAPGETAGHVLQSVIRRHGVKPVALINGQMVRVGEKVDDLVLVKLTETEAVLQGPAGKEILVMSPSVDKKNLRPGRTGR